MITNAKADTEESSVHRVRFEDDDNCVIFGGYRFCSGPPSEPRKIKMPSANLSTRMFEVGTPFCNKVVKAGIAFINREGVCVPKQGSAWEID